MLIKYLSSRHIQRLALCISDSKNGMVANGPGLSPSFFRHAILIFKRPLSQGDFRWVRVIFDPKLVLTKPSLLSGSGRGCGTELCPRRATHHLRRYFTTCRFHHILFLTTSLPHQQYQWVIDLPLTRRALENNCCGDCSQPLLLV